MLTDSMRVCCFPLCCCLPAIAGTSIAIAVIAFGVYYSAQLWPSLGEMTLLDSFSFATLIANVDPVATLAILGAINADKVKREKQKKQKSTLSEGTGAGLAWL